jgi:hypothetical protein
MSADVPRGEITLGNTVSLGFSRNTLRHLSIVIKSTNLYKLKEGLSRAKQFFDPKPTRV